MPKNQRKPRKPTPRLQIELIHEGAKYPRRCTPESVGYDIFTPIDFDIENGKIALIPLGWKFTKQLSGIHPQIVGRSSLNSKGVLVPTGIVDVDYFQEVFCPILNHSGKTYTFKKGDRIGQIIFVPYVTPDLGDPETGVVQIRNGGSGHTGGNGSFSNE
jgi:dUTP pyrophosphatase